MRFSVTPATLVAVHVYVAVSSSSTLNSSRLPSSCSTESRSSGCPFVVQTTSGWGRPSAWQTSRTEPPSRAVYSLAVSAMLGATANRDNHQLSLINSVFLMFLIFYVQVIDRVTRRPAKGGHVLRFEVLSSVRQALALYGKMSGFSLSH